MTSREIRQMVAAQRRDILALINRFGVERADEMKARGNPGGAEAIKTLVRDLKRQIKARYDIEGSL